MSRDRRPLHDATAASVPEAPPSGQWSRVLFLGDEERRRAFAHAVLARLAAACPADRLRVVLHVAPVRQASWAWTRWLTAGDETDLAGRPAFAPGARPTPEEPLVVVVLDGADRDPPAVRNAVVLDLDGRRRRPGRTMLRLDAGPDCVRATWTAHDRTERSAPLPDARAAAVLLGAGPEDQRLTAALDDAGEGHPGVWPPPLTTPPTIDQLLPPLVPTRDRGLTTATKPEGGPLTVPAGLVERPFERLHDVLRVDLYGHLLITGGAGSGKSTLAATLVIALALTHTPREARFYCLDPTGSLDALSGLPHVGAVADEPETAAATIAKVSALLDRPETTPHVFLVVDGPAPDGHDAALHRLATDGPRHGVHLIVTAEDENASSPTAPHTSASTDPPAFVPDAPHVPVPNARHIPGARRLRLDGAGRGTDAGAPFLTALPRLDGVESAQNLPTAVATLVAEIAEHWGDRPGAPGVRTLPAIVPASSLPPANSPLQAVIGLNADELAPVAHDFATAPHLLVFGEAGSGRTNLLRLVAEAITAAHSPVEARILLVDYRGGLLPAMPEEFVLGNAFSAGVLGELVEGTARAIGERLAAPGAARAWQGPRLFILVDDYDRMRDPAPLEPLLEYLPMGYELGAHLVVASADAETAPADALLRGLHDAGAGTLTLSPDLPGRARYSAGGETSVIQSALA